MPSFPNFPPDVTREDVINQILSSIAMEELALSHIMNAEGEKLQYVLGTLSGTSGPGATVEEVLQVNDSVQKMLQTAVQKQMMLGSKMSDALNASTMQGPTGPTGAMGQQARQEAQPVPQVPQGQPEPMELTVPMVQQAQQDLQVQPVQMELMAQTELQAQQAQQAQPVPQASMQSSRLHQADPFLLIFWQGVWPVYLHI